MNAKPRSRFEKRRLSLEPLESRRVSAVDVELTEIPASSGFTRILSEDQGKIYFVSESELWISNGTAAGTTLLKTFSNSNRGGYANISEPTNINGTLFFVGQTVESGIELWKTNGTPAGTVMVRDLSPGTYRSYYGTTARSSAPSDLVDLNGTLFFSASTESGGRELYKSDGTSAGTTLVKEFAPGANGGVPDSLVNVGGELFFTTRDQNFNNYLWKSDGTALGTQQLTFTPRPMGLLYNAEGKLLLSANGDLWTSNGTVAGTTLVKSSIFPDAFTQFLGKTYFQGTDSVENGEELWVTDGTPAGTKLVKNINTSAGASSNPESFANLNGVLLFSADTAEHGRELWRTDGTAAGTVMVKDIRPGAADGMPYGSVNKLIWKNHVLFSATLPSTGIEPWITDGTSQGTKLLKDVFAGASHSGGFGYDFTQVENTVYFSANGTNGQQIWRLTDIPSLTIPSAPVTFTENAPFVPIGEGGLVEQSIAGFAGAVMHVSLTAGARAGDILGIKHVGNGPGQVGVSNGQLSYGGSPIGAFTSGSDTAPLVITFNSSASQTSVRATLRRISYRYAGENPPQNNRKVTISLRDAVGDRGTDVTRIVQVRATNDVPKLILGGEAKYVEGQAPQLLAAAGLVSDPDSPNFAGGRLVVRISANRGGTDELSIRSPGSGPGQIDVVNGQVRIGGNQFGTVTGGTGNQSLAIVFNTKATTATVQTLLRSIAFAAKGNAPSTLTRTISYLLSDGDGGSLTSSKLVQVTLRL